MVSLKEYSGLEPCAPSAEIANDALKKRGLYKIPVREFTDEDINKLIEKFAYATELSLKAGYDGVEIHDANNYLIQQFYSPFTNKRTDEWGGSDENRMKFSLKIIEECCKIREKFNKPEFIIGYRLSPEEPFEDGITMTETMKLIRELIKKPIQFIHLSEKNYFQETRRGEGKGIPRLKVIQWEIKGKVALIGLGGLYTAEDFNKALKSGYSDFIGTGRASMLNKELGILLKEGKYDKINLKLDPDHPEKYSIPDFLWNMCLQNQSWLPPVQNK